MVKVPSKSFNNLVIALEPQHWTFTPLCWRGNVCEKTIYNNDGDIRAEIILM